MTPHRGHGFFEFFAGAGLVRLALQDDWRCLWANDFDPKKEAVYTANFGRSEFHLGDVAEVRAANLPSGAAMAWASFPCQDLSLAGWRRGMSAERSGTFWAFWRIMRDLHAHGKRPPVIVIENVTGLFYGDAFQGLCEALGALDMQVGAMMLDAKHFVPQSRPRAFIVAADTSVDVSTWTSSAPCKWTTTTALTNAYEGLDKGLKRMWRWWKLPKPNGPTITLPDLIEYEPTGVEWHSPEETKHLLDMMTPRTLVKIKSLAESATREIGMLYRRTRNGSQRAEVRCDGLAGCLRTPQGGSSRQTVLVLQDGQIRSRLLSPREAARLMGVPDSYKLPNKYNFAYHAMGDGVAVPVVRWLGHHLLTPVAEAAIRQERRAVEIKVASRYRVRSERRVAIWEAATGVR